MTKYKECTNCKESKEVVDYYIKSKSDRVPNEGNRSLVCKQCETKPKAPSKRRIKTLECSLCKVTKTKEDYYNSNGKRESRCKECLKKMRMKSYLQDWKLQSVYQGVYIQQ